MFSQVYVCPRGCLPRGDVADTPAGQTPHWKDVPLSQCMLGYTSPHPGQCMLGYTPLPADTTGYGQQAGGSHPTGMHSCLECDY